MLKEKVDTTSRGTMYGCLQGHVNHFWKRIILKHLKIAQGFTHASLKFLI